tara:strand:- start:902 stop:1369 length:468 start_codon:yes stop_codon:yes gene_type:complete
MLVYGHDEKIAKWTADLIPHVSSFEHYIGIGYTSNDRLIAGFIFNDYHSEFGTIQLSMAAISPMWARKEVMAEVLRYPFDQLGCYKVFTATPVDNVKAIKVNAHIGFKREAILAHQFGKKRHCVMMRMLRPDYDRLLKENFKWVNQNRKPQPQLL